MAEISGQPDALRRTAAALGEQLPTLERLGEEAPGKRLVFTGMGSSYDACYPTITHLASRGIAAIHLDASELLHFRGNLLGTQTLLVAVSQSGESAEVVRSVERLAADATVFAVTNGTKNTLARLAGSAIDTMVGEESGPSTMTFGAALVALAAIGEVIAGDPARSVVDRVGERAEVAASAVTRLLDRTSLPDELAGWFAGRERSVILGRGPARAAAEMGALTLKEAVGLPIESLQTAQFRHGPLELAGPELAAIVIATEPETSDLDVGLAKELVAAGAGVLLMVGTGDGPPGAMTIELGDIDRSVSSAVSVVPAQLLAWKLAIERGRPPGAYLRASKVTTRE